MNDTNAEIAARLGGGIADGYDDAPRTLWGMTAMQITTAFLAGLYFFDIIRGLLLFVAWAGCTVTITGDIVEHHRIPDGRGAQTVLILDQLTPELSEYDMSIRQRDAMIDVRMERLVGWLRPGTVVGEADHEELVKTLSLIRTNRLDREGKL